MINYRNESRKDYGSPSKERATLEDLQAGALLRIADATELMARDHQRLKDRAETWERRARYSANELERVLRQRTALRGVITRKANEAMARERLIKNLNARADRLEEARAREFKDFQAREEYRKAAAGDETASVWFWQDDGEDHLDSMVNGLPVVIRAEQLRALIAQAKREAREVVESHERLERAIAFLDQVRATPPNERPAGVLTDALDGLEVAAREVAGE